MMNLMTNPLVAFVAKYQKFLTTFTIVVTCLTFLDILKALRGEKPWKTVMVAAIVNFSGLAVGTVTLSVVNQYQWTDGVPQWMLAYAIAVAVNTVFVMIANDVSRLISKKMNV